MGETPSARKQATPRASSSVFPEYRGARWVDGDLPRSVERWPRWPRLVPAGEGISRRQADRALGGRPWVWNGERIHFLCDLHADADAFWTSCVLSGGVAKTGPEDNDFELTEVGRRAHFIVGGDCLDKGPANLRLLRCIRKLMDAGAEVTILAGNHDLRTYLGIKLAGRKETPLTHLFVRMGKKTVRLFEEVWHEYVAETYDAAAMPSEQVIEEILFPGEAWYRDFPAVALDWMPREKIDKELRRIGEKTDDVHRTYGQIGLTLPMVYATLQKLRELFIQPDGEFAWFFRDMKLAHRAGSVLFLHAGVDDAAAECIQDDGVHGLEAWFEGQLREDRLFELYHGPIGNTFRTKYRPQDLAFTERGARAMRAAGIYAIAHGHKNLPDGQRLMEHLGILSFECDCSVDRNTRALEGIPGAGGAVVVFLEDGRVLGLSTDHAAGRLFEPRAHAAITTIT